MIQHRRRPLRSFHQPAEQGHHPLLQPHSVGQTILVDLKALALLGILQGRRLQILQQLLLALAFLLKAGLGGTGGGQGGGGLPPGAPGHRRDLQQRHLIGPGEAVEPAALLAGPGQLLGLTLHGEIQQQGAELQHLAPSDRHAIEPVATDRPSLLQAPVAAEQQLVLLGLQLLLLQPGLHRWRKRETRLDPAALTASAQQPRPLGTLGTAQEGV